MASIEKEVENALLNVVSGVTGVNFFTSERGTARTMPSVTVQASISGEELVPFSGVFKTPASITYVARADTTARADFDAKFYDILEQLYRSPDLASYLTTNSNIIFYVAKVTGDNPAVIGQNRTWSRAMTLDITATAKKAFSPADISGLSLWLKADAGVTLSGSNVTTWADQSGNGNNASSSGGTRPTFVSNTLNSKPVLRFDGAGQQMALTASIGGTAYSIFIVCKNNDNTNGSMFLWSTDANYGKYIGSVTAASYNASARNKFILSENDAGNGEGASVIAWSSAEVFNSYFVGTATENGGGKAYSNGSGGTDSLGTFVESNTFDLIGGYDFGYELDGDVAEIISYNRAVTTPERQQVEAYLNSKYGIY
jgi:hypothetical protein